MGVTRRAIRAAVDQHLAGVAVADADALAELYARDGFFEDPAGGQRHTGRDAVRRHFSTAIEGPRDVTLLSLAVVGREVALLFRAVSPDGSRTEVFDVMSFDENALIIAARAYWPAERPGASSRPAQRSRAAPRTARRSADGSRRSRTAAVT